MIVFIAVVLVISVGGFFFSIYSLSSINTMSFEMFDDEAVLISFFL
jgi:hypothetical protein